MLVRGRARVNTQVHPCKENLDITDAIWRPSRQDVFYPRVKAKYFRYT